MFFKKTTAIFTIIAIIFISLFAYAQPVMAATGVTLTMESLSADGILTVSGSSKTEEFECILVDGGGIDKEFYSDISGQHSFKKEIDTKEFDIGYHTLSAKLYNGDIINFPSAFPTHIYDKAEIKNNSDFLTVGSNFVNFTPYYTVESYDGISLCAQIGNGKKWGNVYGPFKSYTAQKISKFDNKTKLKPNTKYKIRVFYYKNVKYGGESYSFKGPFSKEITFKTGPAKAPAIKSITAKCISQKKNKIGNSAYWDANGVFHPSYSGTIWKTKYKVTVKLKKKPGTKGIYIGDKKVKGNKTTYTVTITDVGKLKGKKVKFGICSYNDDKVGSYSPTVKKSVKIK